MRNHLNTSLSAALAAVATFLIAIATSVPALADTITYYHNDMLGSPIAATDQSGKIIWREDFRPYGERITGGDGPNRIWFTSRFQDNDTGLSYMGARHYDPLTGRFVSPDPVGFSEKSLHSFNRYAYGNNNPLKNIDPNGLWSTDAHNYFIGRFVKQFMPNLSESMIRAIERGSLHADGGGGINSLGSAYQDADHAYMHAQTSETLNLTQARAKFGEYFEKNFSNFEFLTRGGTIDSESGYFYLGMALHPVMDSTSPVHGNWKEFHKSDVFMHGNLPGSKETLFVAMQAKYREPTIRRMSDAMNRKFFDF